MELDNEKSGAARLERAEDKDPAQFSIEAFSLHLAGIKLFVSNRILR
ncbi:hypothetical protein [Metabacillus idriensis]